MSRKNEYDYFDKFVKLADYCCDAAKMLHETLENYNASELQAKMKLMHEIEHEADIEGHEIMRRLAQEFITPIEREDILSLIHQIDDITDNIEDVLLHMYMYNVKKIRNEAKVFTKIIVESCDALRKTLVEFKNFKKSKDIHKGIVLVNKLEEDGDNLFTEAVRILHMTTNDPIEVFTWAVAFNSLEKCCDSCEQVVNVVEGIMMKNS